MPKDDSGQALLKRLKKVEEARGRLGEIAARIRAQADNLSDMLALAQVLLVDSTRAAAPRPRTTARTAKPASGASRTRRAAAKPTTAAKRAAAQRTSAKAATAAPAPARRAKATTTRRRSPATGAGSQV